MRFISVAVYTFAVACSLLSLLLLRRQLYIQTHEVADTIIPQ
jgi:hypothetical protein